MFAQLRAKLASRKYPRLGEPLPADVTAKIDAAIDSIIDGRTYTVLETTWHIAHDIAHAHNGRVSYFRQIDNMAIPTYRVLIVSPRPLDTDFVMSFAFTTFVSAFIL